MVVGATNDMVDGSQHWLCALDLRAVRHARVRRVAKMRIIRHAAAYLWEAVPAGFVRLFTQTSFENSQSSSRSRVARTCRFPFRCVDGINYSLSPPTRALAGAVFGVPERATLRA